MNRFQAFATVAALTLGASPLTAHAYSAFYVFGDSLSDVGNVFLTTGGAEPASPYFNGEFSNGPNWAQDVSHGLGLGTLVPAVAGGTDFAFGGATTGFVASSPPGIPSVTQQVGLFLSAVGSVAPSSALYAVWIGSNDLFNTIGAGVVGPTAVAQAIGAAQTEAAAINALAAAGARNILVPLVSDLGTTPVLTALGGGASAAGTALALAYNAELEADLAGLSAIPGIHLSILDTFTLQDNAVADPAAFGFSNVTDPCYIGALTGGGTVCATPGQFLFWDHEHPTATSHAIIAEAALNEVAEPATFAVLGTGLAGIASLRRRRQQAAA